MSITFEEVVSLAQQLSPLDKVRLIEQLTPALKQELTAPATQTRRSLYGVFADLGQAPSAEEIDEARREMWKNFPREDI